jgi:hypothetical protein
LLVDATAAAANTPAAIIATTTVNLNLRMVPLLLG